MLEVQTRSLSYWGGDDSLPNITSAVEIGRTSGKLRNDVWISSSSQSSWEVDDRYFVDDNTLNPQLIRSQMTWREATPGRSPPATWPSGSRVGEPLTYDEWIACQESIIDKMDYTLNLPDPSVCDEPPQFCTQTHAHRLRCCQRRIEIVESWILVLL